MKGEVRHINGKRVASPGYRSWQMMKNRCLNPNAEDYAYYGARGITVCQDWYVFANFIRDLGRRPSMLHTLERVDGSVGYNKGNCIWATRKQQARNRKYCKITPVKAAVIRSLYQLGYGDQYDIAKDFGVSQRTVSLIVRNESWV